VDHFYTATNRRSRGALWSIFAPALIPAKRNAKLDPKEFPILRKSGAILFDKFDRRYYEGLDLILFGAKEKKIPK